MDPPAEEVPLVRSSAGMTDMPSNTAVFTTRATDNRDAIEKSLDRAVVLARTTAELAQQMSNVKQHFNSENQPLRASTPISPPDTRAVKMEDLEMRMSALFLRQLRHLGLIPTVEQATCPPPPSPYVVQPLRPSAPLAAKASQAVPFDPAQYWRRPVTTVTAAHPGPCGACACTRAAECPPSQPMNTGIRPGTTENPVTARVQEDYPIPAPRITSVPHISRHEPTMCTFAEYASRPRLEATAVSVDN